jgi:hypothetical protein
MLHTKKSAIYSVYECLLVVCFKVYVQHNLSRPTYIDKKSWLHEPGRPFGERGECNGNGDMNTMLRLITVALISLTL